MTAALLQTLVVLASGALVGFSLGLIGGGGSILAMPLLLYTVGLRDIHLAIGTGALAVSANAYINLVGHALKQHVWWRCACVFAACGAIGAFLGSSLGKLIDGDWMLFTFGLLMLVVSVLMYRPMRVRATGQQAVDGLTYAKTAGIAILVGICSGLFGIGGGFLIVPALMFATGMPFINAVGSSLLAVGTFGLTTAINYALSGLVDWPIAGEFITGGIVGGLLGMVLCTRLSTSRTTMSRVFSAIIFVVAIYILWRSLP